MAPAGSVYTAVADTALPAWSVAAPKLNRKKSWPEIKRFMVKVTPKLNFDGWAENMNHWNDLDRHLEHLSRFGHLP